MDDMKSSDLDRSTVETAYARWAPFGIYTLVCFERVVPSAA